MAHVYGVYELGRPVCRTASGRILYFFIAAFIIFYFACSAGYSHTRIYMTNPLAYADHRCTDGQTHTQTDRQTDRQHDRNASSVCRRPDA